LQRRKELINKLAIISSEKELSDLLKAVPYTRAEFNRLKQAELGRIDTNIKQLKGGEK
jgi:hypothetical protein